MRDGKAIKEKASQNTCRNSLSKFFAFGDNSKSELQFIVIHFLYLKKAGKSKHELFMEKVCPCCFESFVCRNDNILECWCLNEPMDSLFRNFLAEIFSGCLCANCITDLRKRFISNQHQLSIGNGKN